MASQYPKQNAQHSRNEGLRQSPGQIRIQNTSTNPRFSFAETPAQLSRPVFEQFASPTNSSINESPVSPSIYHPLSPRMSLGNRSPYSQDKGGQELSVPNYNFPPPQENHPANFAPYADENAFNATHADRPLTTWPARLQLPLSLPVNDSDPRSSTVIHTDHKQEVPVFDLPPKTPTYNPDSFSGPNVASENHMPGQVSHPNSSVNPEWKHGMCEADALCCVGLFCPCMIYGKTQYRLNQKAHKKEATDLLGYESVNGSCALMATACGLQWIFTSIQRTRIRKIYRLNGDVGGDCFKSLYCCCCVLMQNEREIRSREELIRRHAGPASAPYSSPGMMAYPPPPR